MEGEKERKRKPGGVEPGTFHHTLGEKRNQMTELDRPKISGSRKEKERNNNTARQLTYGTGHT